MKNILQQLRLPHRIFLIFIFGVLVPMTVVLGLLFSSLENDLKDQSFQRLRFETKTIAMSIMERLLQLESEMRFFIHNSGSTRKNISGPVHLKDSWYQGCHFEGLVSVGPHGAVHLFGDSRSYSASQLTALKLTPSEKPLLIQQNVPGKAPQLFMAIALSDSEWLIGLIDTKYLWNEGSDFNLPPLTELCIVGPANTIIASSIPETENHLRAIAIKDDHADQGAFTWGNGNETYLAAAYNLFIESSFSGHPWTIILSRPEKAIIGPVKTLEFRLILTGLLAILIVFLLSSISIRRSLGPLNQLTDCAKALSEGDFSKKTVTEGSPELNELSLTFNTMAERIERHLTEIRESEERFRATFEESPAGIALMNAAGRLLKLNRALSKILGYSQEELLSKCIYDFMHPEGIKKGTAQAEDRVDFKSITNAVEMRFFHKEGKIITGLVSSSSLEEDPNVEATYIIHIQDITEQKAGQTENQKLEAQLRQAQKMEAVGTLAGGIAHDFNNILTAVIGYTELAKLVKDEEDRENRDDYLDQVLKASERAKNLVNQILSFSRMREVEKKPIQIDLVIKECLKLLRSSIPSTIKIHQEIETKPSVVITDPTQIHQVLMNLCTNAAHAMREKGGILVVALSHERIDSEHASMIRGMGAGSYAKLTVRDTGHGIDPAIMDRIFEPFFTTKQQGEGTGLGMSVVYGIVKSCGGAIDIVSEPGSGTTISVYLPLVESSKTINKDTSAEIVGGHERILFVDDETTLVDLGERMLRSLGYQVITRTSSIEALELFRAMNADFDLVLTDMTMPNMTGADLAREMLAIRPDIPIILCTGYSEVMTGEKAKDIGIRSFIMKPLTRKDIGKAIRETLKPAEKIIISP